MAGLTSAAAVLALFLAAIGLLSALGKASTKPNASNSVHHADVNMSDHGIMPHSNILLAIGAATLLIKAERICASDFNISNALCSIGDSGFLPFCALSCHNCSQVACWYFWTTFRQSGPVPESLERLQLRRTGQPLTSRRCKCNCLKHDPTLRRLMHDCYGTLDLDEIEGVRANFTGFASQDNSLLSSPMSVWR